jgi:glutamate racemase
VEKHESGRAPGDASTEGDESGASSRRLPIGVFDSGVGGLTVLRALRDRLPHEDFIYLGDTARLPYGTKSAESVTRYSQQAAAFLVRRGIKYLVIACNTASSVAVGVLRERYAPLPVIGVIEPGADAACAASKTGHVAVIATEGTIRGGAYQRQLALRNPQVEVATQACSLFVALAEEGWTEGAIAEGVSRQYLQDMFARDGRIDTLLLGCTHFPVLVKALRATIPANVTIVDSAQTTAAHLAADLAVKRLASSATGRGAVRLLATDGPERFARVGSLFLGETFAASDVELVDLAQAPIG